jgi:hypothetical protein
MRKDNTMSSLTGDLNDNAFVLATEVVTAISNAIEEETGQRPSLEELCEVLVWGLRSCSTPVLRDIDPQAVVALLPKLRTGKRKVTSLNPGDVVAIPSASGGYRLAVFIVKNQNGWALGVLRGRHTLRPNRVPENPDFVEPVFYVHNEGIQTGRWPIVGHAPRLLTLLPARPEVYYDKNAAKLKLDVGPFRGARDAAKFVFRHVSEAEARRVGLLDGSYQAVWLREEFERYLDKADG